MSETPRNHADDPYTSAVPPLPGYHPTAGHAAQPLEGTVHPSSEQQPQQPQPQPTEQTQPQAGYYFSAEQPPVGPPPAPSAPPVGDGATPPRRRMKRPIALVAAVAVLSALAGGVAGGLISEKTTDQASYSTNAVVTGDSSGTSSNTAAIAKAVSPAVVQITVTSGSSEDIGTGIVLTSDGQILTNYHVIANAAGSNGGTVKITFSDGRTATGTVVGTDASLDVAVIKANGVSGLKTASLGDSSKVAVGDQVVAIGNPDGLTGTVTSGIVSALNRPVKVDVSPTTTQSNGGFGLPFWQGDNSRSNQPSSGQTASYNAIQTDASLNPGNSGGPLLNSQGQVVGINASMYSSSGSSSGSSQAGSVGLGFAIPINAVKAVLPQLQSGHSITG
ncbi:S1C family serine protease [Streptacidiphilus sp. MAP12-20]|uniref:S1C family serine protease n=1 Tax=Streptacidiphilus sp. MAP12-20 TaxID=3156299 RepID=UPI00351701F0